MGFFDDLTFSQVSIEYLANRNVEFVVASDIMYQRFLSAPEEFPRQSKFYKSLDEHAALIKTFEPEWNDDGIGDPWCPWCNMLKPDGHTDTCIHSEMRRWGVFSIENIAWTMPAECTGPVRPVQGNPLMEALAKLYEAYNLSSEWGDECAELMRVYDEWLN